MNTNFISLHKELSENGFALIDNIYSDQEIEDILSFIGSSSPGNFHLKTKDVFAIRHLMNCIPELKHLVFNKKLKGLLNSIFPNQCLLTKAIYFDKPERSNWFVAYHQDLIISVDRKLDLEGYINWTYKNGTWGVQPPTSILDETVTVRIHLDDTNEFNGALRVIPYSHLRGVTRKDSETWDTQNEVVCDVKKEGSC